MLQTMKNSSEEEMVWPTLVNHETGRTLSLSPGEQAEVDTPEDFEDTRLVPVLSAKELKVAAKLSKEAPSDGGATTTEES